MIRGLEHLSYKERLDRDGTVHPGKEKAWGICDSVRAQGLYSAQLQLWNAT